MPGPLALFCPAIGIFVNWVGAAACLMGEKVFCSIRFPRFRGLQGVTDATKNTESTKTD
jgi:hypothetical protein